MTSLEPKSRTLPKTLTMFDVARLLRTKPEYVNAMHWHRAIPGGTEHGKNVITFERDPVLAWLYENPQFKQERL